MSWLPSSRTARRRLTLVAAAAPVLALAVGLSLYAMGSGIEFFYSPAQAAEAPRGRLVRIGGLVQAGSLEKTADGLVRFAVTDGVGVTPVTYRGDLPDLFREGQGVIARGELDAAGALTAREVLAKHDERYMPREVADALKKNGDWRGEGQTPAYVR